MTNKAHPPTWEEIVLDVHPGARIVYNGDTCKFFVRAYGDVLSGEHAGQLDAWKEAAKRVLAEVGT